MGTGLVPELCLPAAFVFSALMAGRTPVEIPGVFRAGGSCRIHVILPGPAGPTYVGPIRVCLLLFSFLGRESEYSHNRSPILSSLPKALIIWKSLFTF